MKIYRKAETKKKYEEVDDIDLSKDSKSWVSERTIGEFNLSTKDAYSNQTLGKIVLTEKDVITLYGELVNGWQEKLAESEKLKTELQNYKSFLGRIGMELQGYLNLNSKFEKPENTIKRFEEMLLKIKTFLKN